jgi:hypothetical protein
MAILLTATMLWGGCLSCAQYFMFPSLSAKTCCTPSGHCRDKTPQPSSGKECLIQSAAPSKTLSSASDASVLLSWTALPALAPASNMTPHFEAASTAGRASNASPPDLCLLHSTFRI